MNYLKEFVYSKDKNKVYLIGLLHSVMVCVGMWSLISEMIDLEEPVTTYDLVYTAIHYTVHFILISCLFVGAYIDIPFFLIPWLSASFLTYFYITVLTLISLESRKIHDILIYSMNFIYLTICWYTWYVVFSFLRTTYRNGRICYHKHVLE